LNRRLYVLAQMVKMKTITQQQADAAGVEKPKVYGQRTPNGCVATLNPSWAFFCDYFYRWWIANPAFGIDEETRADKLKSGGYRIVTTMDVNVQKNAKTQIEAGLKTGNRDAFMIAAIEPGTGFVKALAVNRIYGLDTSKNPISSDPNKARAGIRGTYPVTTNPLLTGGQDISGYKSGSTFKIFTVLAALESGYPMDFVINARSPFATRYITSPDDLARCGDYWCPVNANPSYMNGPRTMWSGFGRSVNTYFVPLQQMLGTSKPIAMAKRLGVQFRSSKDLQITNQPKELQDLFGPFTLGVTDTVPLELANAYATVAAEGKYCKPMPLLHMYTTKNQQLTEVPDIAGSQCSQVVNPEIARAAADIARCPVGDNGGLGKCDGGTANINDGRYVQDVMPNYPVIGKTGTADENWTANLVLSTKQLTMAGVMANPDHAETPHEYNASAVVVDTAVAFAMRDSMKGQKPLEFAKPTNQAIIYGKRVNIPNVTCKSVQDATNQLKPSGFDVAVDPTPVDSPCPAGTVARTDPSGTGAAGTSVTLILSKGRKNQPGPNPSDTSGPGGPGGGGGGGGGPGGTTP
jgi:membrane peptidoglycan carboxypeptidase